MRPTYRLSFAAAPYTSEVGLQLAGVENELLGDFLLWLTLLLLVWAAVGFIQSGFKRPQRVAEEMAGDGKPSSETREKFELSEYDRLAMQSVSVSMLGSGSHEHELDTVAMIEDIQAGRPLQGPCGICGKPRLRE